MMAVGMMHVNVNVKHHVLLDTVVHNIVIPGVHIPLDVVDHVGIILVRINVS